MKKIRIVREELNQYDDIKEIVEVFRKEGYEITEDQAHCLGEICYWNFIAGITIEEFVGDWKEI